MTLRDQLIEQALALALPPEDRGYVAHVIEESLNARGVTDPGIAAAWTQEIERRVEAYRCGETSAVEFDTAMREVRDALEKRRAARAGLS